MVEFMAARPAPCELWDTRFEPELFDSKPPIMTAGKTVYLSVLSARLDGLLWKQEAAGSNPASQTSFPSPLVRELAQK